LWGPTRRITGGQKGGSNEGRFIFKNKKEGGRKRIHGGKKFLKAGNFPGLKEMGTTEGERSQKSLAMGGSSERGVGGPTRGEIN